MFKGREDMVLNYNPHPSQRAGIAQILCPKENRVKVIEELKKRKIYFLPVEYNPLELSPRCKHLGPRKEKALINHLAEVLRNWERCARQPRDESPAQFSENLLKEAKEKIRSSKATPQGNPNSSGAPPNSQDMSSRTLNPNSTCDSENAVDKGNVNPNSIVCDENRGTLMQKPISRPLKPSGTPPRLTRQKTAGLKEDLSQFEEAPAA